MKRARTSFQNHPTSNDILLWTRAYRIAALVALVLVVYLMGSGFVASSCPAVVVESEQINPNTAPLGSLVRLDGIGTARAMDIIHFRQTYGVDGPAFKTADDLQAIRGIGPKTVEKLTPWMTFEEEAGE